MIMIPKVRKNTSWSDALKLPITWLNRWIRIRFYWVWKEPRSFPFDSQKTTGTTKRFRKYPWKWRW
jgi:hypothetical protein